ncbi:MAG: hypothetical protein ABIR96_00235 [Bdellovibrionota bacterium]
MKQQNFQKQNSEGAAESVEVLSNQMSNALLDFYEVGIARSRDR